ncbi:DUF4251 domain-containing protein [Mucilaginibacter sp. L196]|uniref:DUF4251 domain-containing protein n=1 Tax=Mucilaginibacter sp. L196 TaxID=1641870 RepID=UPI00131BEEEC|nr:DUF4251 domain-containing protein [Mucilaginibacter sp. L196]
MKTPLKISLPFLLMLMIVNANAQQTAKQIKAQEKAASIKHKINAQKYTFIAQYAQPLRGGQKYLTSDYDLRVKRDSIIAWLPYFGRAYMDVPYNSTDDGIKFTSTKFDYKIVEKKKGGWTITIVLNDVRRSQKLFLDVFTNGSATLQVASNSRDAITFQGYIKDDDK